MPEIIDLNAARAARLEKLGDAPVVAFGPEQFKLPAELPADFAFLTADGKFHEGIRAVLGDQFDLFWQQQPSMDDLLEFVEGVTRCYGFGDTGESSASGTPSETTGKRSRPTSKGSTRST
jgi:hypothetical protein